MTLFCKFLFATLCLSAAVLYKIYNEIGRALPVPQLDLEAYWGPGNATSHTDDQSVKTFDIKTSPELIEELKAQLSRPFKYIEPLEGVAFEYGFNTKKLQEIVTYWRDDYLTRWNERENFLKKFQHFETIIQGLRIHFLRIEPKTSTEKKVLPLLLIHGWPGSIREFYDIIPKLTTASDSSDYVFEVIVPSLPGYVWSQASAKRSFGPAEIAVVLRNLMIRLGHERFLIQGGDWGAILGSNIATIFPQNVIGYHSNMCSQLSTLSILKLVIINLYPSFFLEKHQESFHLPIIEKVSYLLEESGYFHLQATKPDTIGVALSYNPVGLLAYILEKFSTWTHLAHRYQIDGGLTKKFKIDALLDNVMLYYVTNSITTSQRIYAEFLTKKQVSMHFSHVQTTVSTGCARFKNDLLHSTDWQLREKYTNLIHSTYHQEGGHFAAMEVPTKLYEDFVQFVNKCEA